MNPDIKSDPLSRNSLLMTGALTRLLGASLLSVFLWLAVVWALYGGI